MIDVQAVDQIFDEAIAAFGSPPGCNLFDKRVAVPLHWLPEMVQAETGEVISPNRLNTLLPAGWIPAVESGDGSGGPAVPLYIPSRIGLFLRLEREGYTPEELRALADYEEGIIDGVIAADDLEYLESDFEVMHRWITDQIRSIKEALAEFEPDHPQDSKSAFELAPEEQRAGASQAVLVQRLENEEGSLAQLTRVPWKKRSTAAQRQLSKIAFRIRMCEEMIRLTIFQQDRAKVEKGYSPMVEFINMSGDFEGNVEFSGIRWQATVHRPWSTEDGIEVPLRVPGFVLRGGNVSTSRTLVPSEYARLWQENSLDEYVDLQARLANQRICRHCKAMLPADADVRRVYCDARCQSAAKQRRWRLRNPKKYIATQQRYWTT